MNQCLVKSCLRLDFPVSQYLGLSSMAVEHCIVECSFFKKFASLNRYLRFRHCSIARIGLACTSRVCQTMQNDEI